MSAKNLKAKRQSLSALSRPQLIALAKQKTDVNYQILLHSPVADLIELLLPVSEVLEPEAV